MYIYIYVYIYICYNFATTRLILSPFGLSELTASCNEVSFVERPVIDGPHSAQTVYCGICNVPTRFNIFRQTKQPFRSLLTFKDQEVVPHPEKCPVHVPSSTWRAWRWSPTSKTCFSSIYKIFTNIDQTFTNINKYA